MPHKASVDEFGVNFKSFAKISETTRSLALGEPFGASREMAPVFSTPSLDFAHLMADEKIDYFMIENE